MEESVDEDFVRLEQSTRSSVSRSIDGGSFVGEVETGPTESELLRIIECPVCTEFPIPPIFNCANGHFTCNECITVLTSCTLCEAKFTQVRNYALESIIESTKFKCRYTFQGCTESVTGAEFRNHMDNCPYGPLTCNENRFTTCENRVVESVNYLDHLFLCHNALGQTVDSKELTGNFHQEKGEDFPPIYLKSETNGLTFFLKTKKYKSFYCWWVSCLNPSEIGNYKARLTWTKKFATNEEGNLEFQSNQTDSTYPYNLQWTLPVHPEKKSFNEIRDSGLCAVLPDTHMKPFAFDSNSDQVDWNISFEIISTSQTKDSKNTKLEIDLKSLLETLRHYFPLIALVFMSIAVLLLCGIYFKTPSEDVKYRHDNFKAGIEDREDFEGYRGFYYRNNPNLNSHQDNPQGNPNLNFPHQNYKHEGNKKYGKGKEHESNDGDEFVGYRGFYHSKTDESNQGQNANYQSELKTIVKKLVNQFLTSLGNKVMQVFGMQAKDKSFKDSVGPREQQTKSTSFNVDGLDVVGKLLAKFFVFSFTVICIFTVLVFLAFYKRWLFSEVPAPDRRPRR